MQTQIFRDVLIPYGLLPLVSNRKRQSCVSHSTPEAEIAAGTGWFDIDPMSYCMMTISP